MQVEPKENLKSSTGIPAPRTLENTRTPPRCPHRDETKTGRSSHITLAKVDLALSLLAHRLIKLVDTQGLQKRAQALIPVVANVEIGKTLPKLLAGKAPAKHAKCVVEKSPVQNRVF